jgi:hypothetical protein
MASRRRRALLRFFVLGGLLLAASRWLLREPEEIVIGPGELAAARAEGLSLLGRPPQGGELDALLEARAREEILYREALSRGLDREDAGVRRRLVRNLSFLRGGAQPAAGAAPAADEEALYREALALGMDRSDTVVRRLLVQRVKLEIEAPARAAEPGDAELRVFLAAHPEAGRGPRRVAFRQLFFDPARRGAEAEADAHAALAALAAGAEPPAGDPCLAASEQPLQAEPLVARLLGPDFAAGLFEAPADAWAGPLRSSLGWHAVRVESREDGAPLRFESLRPQLRDALLEARAAAALEAFLAERRASYRVRVLPAETADAR